MESFENNYQPYKLKSNCEEDIYTIIKRKSKEFLENIHNQTINDRFFLKNQSDMDKFILKDIKSKNFNHILYYKHYNNKSIDNLNDEDAICFLDFEENRIFIEFNENLFNFNNLQIDEKLVILDLIGNDDNPDFSNSLGNADFDNVSNSVSSSNDLIAINNFPISISHTNLILNYDKCFSQLLSNELITQALEIFNLTKNNSLKLGFDSLGAGCFINHLHFECIWIEDFNFNRLAIEDAFVNKLFDTNLIYQVKEENEFCLVSYYIYYIHKYYIL